MAGRPVIREAEQVKNWISQGNAKAKDNICTIRPADGKEGRSKVGDWIPISGPRVIPGGKRFLMKRSADNETVYVHLPEALGPGDEPDQPQDGEILDSSEAEITRAILTLNAIDQAVESSSKAVKTSREAMQTLDEANERNARASKESAQAELFRTLGGVANRLMDMLATWRHSPADPFDGENYKKFLALKTHIIREGGADIDDVKPGDLATLIRVSKHPAICALIDQIQHDQLRGVTTAAVATAFPGQQTDE